jgi:hypothetical protein
VDRRATYYRRVAVPELTETTIRYLYATTWLPCDTKEHTVAVPGGTTTAIDTAGNLLHIAMWSLRRQGLMEFEQLRPVEEEKVRILGGRPFARFELLDPSARLRGLEGALLRAAAGVGPAEDERDVRRLVRALDLDNRSPWNTVCNHCFAEAAAAGLVKAKGRLFPKVVFTDLPAVESLRERHDGLRAARGAYLDAEPELTTAVISDCLRTVIDAYSPDLGD